MIRQATIEDIPAISHLIKSEPGMWQKEWSDDVLNRAINSSDGLAFVWDENGIVGFVCGHDVGFRGYLSELMVSPVYRGKGIGGNLVRCVQNEMAKRGCHLIMADIWHEAQRFYESLGWVKIPKLVTLWKNDL